MERREPCSTVGGDVKRSSHCAERYGDPSAIKHKCQVVQRPPSWVHVRRKQNQLQEVMCSPTLPAASFTVALTEAEAEAPGRWPPDGKN